MNKKTINTLVDDPLLDIKILKKLNHLCDDYKDFGNTLDRAINNNFMKQCDIISFKTSIISSHRRFSIANKHSEKQEIDESEEYLDQKRRKIKMKYYMQSDQLPYTNKLKIKLSSRNSISPKNKGLNLVNKIGNGLNLMNGANETNSKSRKSLISSSNGTNGNSSSLQLPQLPALSLNKNINSKTSTLSQMEIKNTLQPKLVPKTNEMVDFGGQIKRTVKKKLKGMSIFLFKNDFEYDDEEEDSIFLEKIDNDKGVSDKIMLNKLLDKKQQIIPSEKPFLNASGKIHLQHSKSLPPSQKSCFSPSKSISKIVGFSQVNNSTISLKSNNSSRKKSHFY